MGFHTYQTNFTGGELSPYLFSRSDFKKYPNGAELLYNAVVKVSGGAVRRAGTMFVSKGKSRGAFQPNAFQNSAFQIKPNGKLLLKEFIFNTQEAYVLEFGAQYIRFYRNRKQLLGSGAGSELVLNGTFATDLSSWTLQQDSGATVTWDSGHAVLSPGLAGTAGISQQIAGLDPGTTYVLNFTSGGVLDFQVGTTLGAGDVVQPTAITAGQYRATFVAPAGGTVVLYWRATQPNVATVLDDVSMLSAVPLEVATPYLAADLRMLRFDQSADVLYIAHPKYRTRKLTRLSDILWTLQEVVLSPPPSEEVPLQPSARLTPAATTGQGVTFTAGASVFLAADINRQIKSQGGLAVITAFVSGTQVTADIVQPFLSTTPIGEKLWSMDGSPSTNLTLSATGPVNSIVSATAVAAAFRATDVGGFILGLAGIFEITEVSSSTSVKARCLAEATGTALVSGAWTLEFESFSETLGFPDVPAFFEQRFWLAKKQDLHGSVSGDFENFKGGSKDDDAVRFPIAGRVDVIRWMKTLKNFVLGTIGSEYKVDGGDSLAITPTNVHALPQSDWGSDPEPDAIRAGVAALFVQRGRRNIREIAFDFAKDGYDAADLTLLADHLFRSGIVQLARCSSPDSFVFAVLEDGLLAACSYARAEDVVGWSQIATRGQIRSVCVIPSKCGSGDEVWIAVERTINGRLDIYIEVFDGQLNTDCALVYDGGEVLADTITGFNHLANEPVDVLYSTQSAFQKNAFQVSAFQRKRVKYKTDTISSGGVITVPSSTRVEAGLHYDSRLKTLRPDPAGQVGTAQFQTKRSSTVYVRLFCSGGDGVKVNGEAIKQNDLESKEIFDFVRAANLGWDRDGQVTIEQTKPYPMTVLGIAYAWSVSDGDKP